MYLWRASTVWWSTFKKCDENYVWKNTGWGHWCIVCVIADKKENGTVWWHVYNKSVMALVSLVHYVWIDQRYSVMALIQKCDDTYLHLKKKYSVMALVHNERKYSVMTLVQKVWWHLLAFEKKKYSVMALVHCVLRKKRYSVMALVQKMA